MDRQGHHCGALFVLVLGALVMLVVPAKLRAEGGHGVGITFAAWTDSSMGPGVPADFFPYTHSSNLRIRTDFNVLLSQAVRDSIAAWGDQPQDIVDSLLTEIDLKSDNEFEFGLPTLHDFGVVYNYFSNAAHPYGEWPPEKSHW